MGAPLETITSNIRFVLELRDAFTRGPVPPGSVDVQIAHQWKPFSKAVQGLWIFPFLPDGAFAVQVRPNADVPYYLPVDIPITLPAPDPFWPAFPDRSLADLNLSLDDPAQPAPYRAQRELARLKPSAAYPFPPTATLIRGTVRAGGLPLADAIVSIIGGIDLPYTAGADGNFVIFIDSPQNVTQDVTLRASHLFKPDVDLAVTAVRNATVSVVIDMAP
jgi:hypothetical protein